MTVTPILGNVTMNIREYTVDSSVVARRYWTLPCFTFVSNPNLGAYALNVQLLQ